MPYIRYKGRMFNVTSNEYIDESPQMYSFFRYTGDQITANDDNTIRTDIDCSVYMEGDLSTNIGYRIEEEAKRYYYDSGLVTWPTLRILTTNDNDDYYIQWSHNAPNTLVVKANGITSVCDNVLLWNDDIELVGTVDPVPRFLVKRARVYTNVRDKEELNTIATFISGSFAPNETLAVWDTMISVSGPIFSILRSDCIRYSRGDGIGGSTVDANRNVDKTNDGIGIYYWAHPTTSGTMYSNPVSWEMYVDNSPAPGWDARMSYRTGTPTNFFTPYPEYPNVKFGVRYILGYGTTFFSNVPIIDERGFNNVTLATDVLGISITYNKNQLYEYLSGVFDDSVEPPSDVDPEDIPPEDEPPAPIPPDSQDPYYDPESDPTSPTYDPIKDPTSPSYDPSTPSTPYKPPSQPTILEMPVVQPTPTVIPTPVTPPSYVTNDLFTLYNPSGGDLTSIANFLWSPAWSVDTFKKIFANPLDCILGLLVLPHLDAVVATKTMNIGNISTGISLHYFTSQFFDFDCGTFALPEYYQSYLDYSPYTKVSIFLPYIGDQELNTDEVMGKNIGVKYRFDLATGDCIAFISVDGDVLYSFAGNCAARLPLSANNYAGIIPAITSAAIRASTIPSAVSAIGAASALAVTAMKQSASHTGSLSGSAGLMGIQTPYLIVSRPRQALPLSQNSFKGYPSFITESLSQLNGYTEVDQVHLEHVPATADELIEIERLLKEGVLF